jgi:3-oxoacyl-[acyl-carrier protein] reductase
MGKPEEIAHSAAYIFENDYYTGRILKWMAGCAFKATAKQR